MIHLKEYENKKENCSKNDNSFFLFFLFIMNIRYKF